MSMQNVIRSIIIPTNKAKTVSTILIQNTAIAKVIFKIGIHFIPLINEYKSV